MKTLDGISNKTNPLLAIDESLNKLSEKIKFQKKLEKTNENLSKAKLPLKK